MSDDWSVVTPLSGSVRSPSFDTDQTVRLTGKHASTNPSRLPFVGHFYDILVWRNRAVDEWRCESRYGVNRHLIRSSGHRVY